MSGGTYQTTAGENNPGVVDFAFSCVANGSGATTLPRGYKLTTAARTTTGVYTFTLDETVKRVVWMAAAVDDNSSGTATYRCTCYADETASPLVVKVYVFLDDAVSGIPALADPTSLRVRLFVKGQLSAIGTGSLT